MPYVIRIETSGDFIKADYILRRFKARLPKMTKEQMKKWGKILEKELKASARRADIRSFTGTLATSGIRYEQKPRGKIGKLFIRQYGIYLDSMGPHYVNVTRRRTILLAWASRAYMPRIRQKAKAVESGKRSKFSIRVHRHPFIRMGFKVARPQLTKMLKQSTAKAISGR